MIPTKFICFLNLLAGIFFSVIYAVSSVDVDFSKIAILFFLNGILLALLRLIQLKEKENKEE